MRNVLALVNLCLLCQRCSLFIFYICIANEAEIRFRMEEIQRNSCIEFNYLRSLCFAQITVSPLHLYSRRVVPTCVPAHTRCMGLCFCCKHDRWTVAATNNNWFAKFAHGCWERSGYIDTNGSCRVSLDRVSVFGMSENASCFSYGPSCYSSARIWYPIHRSVESRKCVIVHRIPKNRSYFMQTTHCHNAQSELTHGCSVVSERGHFVLFIVSGRTRLFRHATRRSFVASHFAFLFLFVVLTPVIGPKWCNQPGRSGNMDYFIWISPLANDKCSN